MDCGKSQRCPQLPFCQNSAGTPHRCRPPPCREVRSLRALRHSLAKPFHSPSRASPADPTPRQPPVLGLIPASGPMVQRPVLSKGLIHVVIFACWSSIAELPPASSASSSAAWVSLPVVWRLPYRQGSARRPAPPDPLGLNEVGNWLNLGKSRVIRSAGPRLWSGPAWVGAAQLIPVPRHSLLMARDNHQTPYQGSCSRRTHRPRPAMSIRPYRPFARAPLYWRRKEPIGRGDPDRSRLVVLLGQMEYLLRAPD